MFLRPDLAGDVAHAPLVTGRDFGDLVRLARAKSWPGYFGSPRVASAALGAFKAKQSAAYAIDLANKILDGKEWRSLPRYADTLEQDPRVREVDRAALEHDAKLEKRQREWISKRANE
jgi:hypothetical protein